MHITFFPAAIRRPLGYCAPYNGRVCKKHLRGPGLVWYNITATDQGGWLNEHITRELWSEMINNFRELCREAAEVSFVLLCWLRLCQTLSMYKNCNESPEQKYLMLDYYLLFLLFLFRNCCVTLPSPSVS